MYFSLNFLTMETMLSFVFAMFRLQAFFLVAPIFSQKAIPAMVKIGSSALICFWLYDSIFKNAKTLIFAEPYLLTIGIFYEILVGFLLGSITHLIFDVVAFFGQLIGIQSGHNADHVFNPSSTVSTNALAAFYSNFAMLAFLATGGMYHLAIILRKSFELFPLANSQINFSALAMNYPKIFGEIFLLGLKFFLPLLALIFVIDMAIAIFSKILPQASMYFLLMPVKLVIFGVFIILGLGGFWMNLDQYFAEDIYRLLDTLF